MIKLNSKFYSYIFAVNQCGIHFLILCTCNKMKLKVRLLLLFVLATTSILINSCKKSKQDYIETLITGNQWQLSSAMVTTYIGSGMVSEVTLDTTCNLAQMFRFNSDKSCTYTNFDCLTQTSKGTWLLSNDKLFLYANMTCQDTTTAKRSKPFLTARIVNLGQYSLILQTGDLQTYYSPTQKRIRYQWGFVRVKSQ